MPENCLFEALPDQAAPERPLGKPRLLEPQRDQIELRAMDIDSLIGRGPSGARDLGLCRTARSRARWRIGSRRATARAGHPAITPRLLLALWLYATSEGVGSARALARLCESHDAYRWLVRRGVGELSHAGGLPGRSCRSARPAAGRASGGAGRPRPGRSRRSWRRTACGSAPAPGRPRSGAARRWTEHLAHGASGGRAAQARGRRRSGRPAISASARRRQRAARERVERVGRR